MTDPLLKKMITEQLEEMITAQRKKMRAIGTTPEAYIAIFGDKGEEMFVADLTQLVWLIFGANMDKEFVEQFVLEVVSASKKGKTDVQSGILR